MIRSIGIFCFAALALTQAASAQDLPPGPDQMLVTQACTTCHLASQFTSQRKTAGEWAQAVNQMIDKGAVIGDNEFDQDRELSGQEFRPGEVAVDMLAAAALSHGRRKTLFASAA